MPFLLVVLVLAAAGPAMAQVLSRPADPPIVTASSESWYVQREPLQFAGDVYYPAGAAVFFNGNTMVRTGHYNGVPLYADTTLEPYSIVYVPVARGMMQPYERFRRGNLAGTTGSRTPSFPVAVLPDQTVLRGAPVAVAPTDLPRPIGAVSAYTPAIGAAPSSDDGLVGAAQPARPPVNRVREAPVATLMKPEGNDGVWISFMGRKWLSAGAAVVLTDAEFMRAGEYAGFAVYRRRDVREDMVYLPTRGGLVAPYRLKP